MTGNATEAGSRLGLCRHPAAWGVVADRCSTRSSCSSSGGSSAAARSRSSGRLALKNGSTGPVSGNGTVAEPVARGPDIDLADPLVDDRAPQLLAQPHRPQPDHRMRLAARRGAGQIGAGLCHAAHAAARPDRAAETARRSATLTTCGQSGRLRGGPVEPGEDAGERAGEIGDAVGDHRQAESRRSAPGRHWR